MSDLPVGWEVKYISEIADMTMGYAFKSSDFVRVGIPLVRMGNLYQNQLQLSRNPVFLPYEFAEQYSKFLLKEGDLIMSMTGTMGKRDYGFTVQIPSGTPSCLLNQRVLKLNSKKNSIINFLKFLFKSEYVLVRLYAFPGGTKQANLSTKQVGEIQIKLPPLPEQRKIAQILSTWDKAIATTEKQIANSKQQKKALMQQLLAGKKRLAGFCGDWKSVQLNELIQECKKEKENCPEKIELLTVKLHNQGVVKTGKYPKPTKNGRPYYKRFQGELIIGRQNLHNGGVAIVPRECNGLIASNAISSFTTLDMADIQFILAIMGTAHFKYVIDNLTGGTGQKEVSTKNLLKVQITVPNLKEQQKIAQVLTTADNDISTLETQLTHLQQEKKALMQQLLTGKRRVVVELGF